MCLFTFINTTIDYWIFQYRNTYSIQYFDGIIYLMMFDSFENEIKLIFLLYFKKTLFLSEMIYFLYLLL